MIVRASLTMFQLGGISLLTHRVLQPRHAEVNLLFSPEEFIPAKLFTGASGFLINAAGMPTQFVFLASIVTVLARILFGFSKMCVGKGIRMNGATGIDGLQMVLKASFLKPSIFNF